MRVHRYEVVCTHLHMCRIQRSRVNGLFDHISPYPLQTGSLTVPGARLAINKPQPSSSAYHNAMATDIPMIMPRLFYMGTEIWTQFLMLAWTLTH